MAAQLTFTQNNFKLFKVNKIAKEIQTQLKINKSINTTFNKIDCQRNSNDTVIYDACLLHRAPIKSLKNV